MGPPAQTQAPPGKNPTSPWGLEPLLLDPFGVEDAYIVPT